MSLRFRSFWNEHGAFTLSLIFFAGACGVLVLAILDKNARDDAQEYYCARQGMTLVHGYCLTPEETITRRARTTDDSKEAGQ